MQKMIRFLLFCLGALYFGQLQAQQGTLLLKAIPDTVVSGQDCPNTFARAVFVNHDFQDLARVVSPSQKGFWLTVPQAASLHVFFEVIQMNSDSYLEVHSNQAPHKKWRYTTQDIAQDQSLTTFPLAGDSLWIALYEPKSGSTLLSIKRVDVGLRPLESFMASLRGVAGFGDAASCQININCAPYGTDFDKAKRSVALMMTSSMAGSGFCTGTLINNSQYDQKRLFLTANHCGFGISEGSYAPWLFLFNYESLACTSPSSDPYSPTSHKLVGATARVVNASSDVLLLELAMSIPDSFNVIYSGWNRDDRRAASGALIHHAQGDLKKVSTCNSGISSSAFGGLAGSGGSHWRVQWSAGVTEGASSGAAFFDAQNKIRGWLDGGSSSCASPFEPDYLRKLSVAWPHLQPWLSPCNPQIQSLEALQPSDVPSSKPHTGRFNGVSDVIHDPAASSLTKNITIEGWVNPEVLTDTQAVFSWGSEAYEAATMRVLPGGYVEYAEYFAGTWRSVVSSQRISAWRWAHLAVVKIEKTAQIFIDGQPDNSALLDTLEGGLTTANIGAFMRPDASYKYFFKGLIDELRVWKKIRTGAEIDADKHAHLVPFISGLVRLWRADEGGGLHIADLTGNSAGGTLPRADMWVRLSPVSLHIRGSDSLCANSIAGYKAQIEGCEPIRSDARLVFEWSVVNGIILSGQGTDSVTVLWGVAGEGTLLLKARHSNHFLNISASSLPVYLASPPLTPPIQVHGTMPIACGDSLTLFVDLPATSYHLQPRSFQPAALSTPTILSLLDSQWTSPLGLGFDFKLFGQTYNTVRVGANGLICIGISPVSAYIPEPQALPLLSFPNALVALVWTRLLPSHGGTISYELQGAAPFRRWTLRYQDVPLEGDLSKKVSAHLVLFESLNKIECHLESVPLSSGIKTMGVQMPNGEKYSTKESRNGLIWPAVTLESWEFLPQNAGFSWTDSSSSLLLKTVFDHEEGNFQYTYRTDSFCLATSPSLFVSTDCYKPPVIDFPTVVSVTDYTAVLGATVISDKGLPILEKGIVWSTSPMPTVSTGTKINVLPLGLGIFSKLTEDLPPATLVYFRGFARNAAGISYTTNTSFTTLPDTSPPLIETLSPPDNALDVSPLTGFSIAFNEPVQTSGTATLSLFTAGGVLVETFDIAGLSNVLSISVSLGDTLLPSTAYYLLISSLGVTDMYANPLGAFSSSTWNFTTGLLPLPPALGVTPLSKPSLLSARAVSSNEIVLKWQDNASDETGNRVFRRNATSTEFVKIAELGALSGLCTYSDLSLLPDATYTYYIQAYRSDETQNSNLATETTYPLPPFAWAVGAVCAGQTAELRAGGSTGLYKWYDAKGEALSLGGKADSLLLLPGILKDSTLWVVAQGQKYESLSKVSATALVKALPEAQIITPPLRRSCESAYIISAADVGEGLYEWLRNGVKVAEGSSPHLRITESGSYSVRVTKNACQALSESVRFELNYKPEAKILAEDSLIACEGEVLQAKLITEAAYQWYKADFLVANGRSLRVPESGQYILRVEQYGCVAYDTVWVNLLSFPNKINLWASTDTLCEASSYSLLTSSYIREASYHWFRNNKVLSVTTINELEVRDAGLYRVEIWQNSSCKRSSDNLRMSEFEPKLKVSLRGTDLVLAGTDSSSAIRVEWYKDDTILAGWSNQISIKPTESGDYKAFVVFKNGCSLWLSFGYWGILGSTKELDSELQVYPNPTQGQVCIQGLPLYQTTHIELCDVLGRVLWSDTFAVQGSRLMVGLPPFEKGLYLLKIGYGLKRSSHKLLLE